MTGNLNGKANLVLKMSWQYMWCALFSNFISHTTLPWFLLGLILVIKTTSQIIFSMAHLNKILVKSDEYSHNKKMYYTYIGSASRSSWIKIFRKTLELRFIYIWSSCHYLKWKYATAIKFSNINLRSAYCYSNMSLLSG